MRARPPRCRPTAGIPLDGAPRAERVRRADAPAQVDRRDEPLEVRFAREDVRVERDRILGARTGEAQRAAAERAHEPAQQREAVLGPGHPLLVHRHHEVDRLDVGRRQPRPRAPEEMRLAGGQAGRGRPDLALGAEDHRREQVVVEVLTDAGQVRDDVDADASAGDPQARSRRAAAAAPTRSSLRTP